MYLTTTRTSSSARPSDFASCSFTFHTPCDDSYTVRCLPSQSAIVQRVWMSTWYCVGRLNVPSLTTSASANPAATSPRWT